MALYYFVDFVRDVIDLWKLINMKKRRIKCIVCWVCNEIALPINLLVVPDGKIGHLQCYECTKAMAYIKALINIEHQEQKWYIQQSKQENNQ